MPQRVIDLNCDLGEGMPTDAAIMPFISSANIACGFHAGDADTMKRTVELCLDHNVAIGAHPSFDDRPDFGRREIQLPPADVYSLVFDQLNILQEVCITMGAKMVHVKPHGALYNMSARQPALAAAIAKAVHDFNPYLKLFGLAGSCSLAEASAIGLTVVHEFFADRTYQPDGSLTPRNQPGALIEGVEQAVEQAIMIAAERAVVSTNGTIITPAAHESCASICLHGDGKNALLFAQQIHEALLQAGFSIESFA